MLEGLLILFSIHWEFNKEIGGQKIVKLEDCERRDMKEYECEKRKGRTIKREQVS